MEQRDMYVFGPRLQRTVMFGLRASQIVVWGCAALVSFVLVSLSHGLSAFAVVLLLVGAASFWSWGRVGGHEASWWMPSAARFLWRRWRGQGVYENDGEAAPPFFGGVEVWGVDVGGRKVGVVEADGYVAAVVRVRGRPWEMETSDIGPQHWGRVLDEAASDRVVARLQVVVRSVRMPSMTFTDWWRSHRAVAPSSALNESYEELLRRLGRPGQEIETFVSVGVTTASAGVEVKDRQERVERLGREAASALQRLVAAMAAVGVSADELASPGAIRRLWHDAWSPEEADGTVVKADEPDQGWVWPREAAEGLRMWRTAGAAHRVLWVESVALRPVYAGFLAPLILIGDQQRTVVQVLEPVRRERAKSLARDMAAVMRADMASSSKAASVEDLRKVDAAMRVETDITDGRTGWLMNTYVVVSHPDPEGLEATSRDVRALMERSFLHGVVLDGVQAAGFSFALPGLMRGL